MFSGLDETAADVPVRDLPSRLAEDPSDNQNARARQDVSRVSREELEDRFLRVHEETLVLKQHVHKQEDKIKKLGTKLMRLVKDRGRMEQLALGGGGGGGPVVLRQRDVEMEELMEELQEKVRSLQAEKEGVKRRLLVAKQQQVNSHSRRPAPYGRVPSRVNSGLKSSSPLPQAPPKSSEGGGRPPTGLLPRFGHSLLEETRAEVRNLEKVVELQRRHLEEVQAAAEELREELRRKEKQHQERLLQVREQQTSRLRMHVSSNVEMIRLQKQMVQRTERTAELEGRFLGLQESQRALKVAHEAAMLKVDQLSAQLKEERLRSLDQEARLQSASISRLKVEQLQERISEVEQERDLLKDDNDRLVHRAFDGSQEQRAQIQEQKLKLQIAQLEAALKADLVDKNEILDKIKAERDTNEKLAEENRKLHLQTVEQKQQLEELQGRLKSCSREELHEAELTEALLLIKKRQSQRSGDLCFLQEVEEGGGGGGRGVSELQAAHAETIQELQKTRNLLSMEARISKDYQAELQGVLKKMEADKVTWEQQLERQATLLDSRAAKVQRLEAQLRDLAYGTKPSRPHPAVSDEDECPEEAVVLGAEENLVELQVVGATLSLSALQALGGGEPSTFCTYAFYLFEPHATPVAAGRAPAYGFTSRYVVTEDRRLLDFLRCGAVTVEMHEARGLDWRTLARARLRLQPLLHDGTVSGTAPLVGVSEDTRSFGSVDYWLRLKLPLKETLHLNQHQPPAGWNQLSITVRLCRDLKRAAGSGPPSPYVVYKFYDFPDHPTATVPDCCDPALDDLRSYSVRPDAELDRYLRAEALRLYVFDEKEQRMDSYLGKTRVPLLPLTRDRRITGAFQLTDPSGLAAGLIEVTLQWRSAYVFPPDAIVAAEEAQREEEEEEEEEAEEALQEEDNPPEASGSKVCGPGETRHALDRRQAAELPELRPRTRPGDQGAKKVSFMDPAAPGDQEDQEDQGDQEDQEDQLEDDESADQRETSAPVVKGAAEEEEEEEEESHFSEGQLVPVGSQSHSDDSEVSEDIVEDVEASQSDSDDCIVQERPAGRKPSQRLRVEVLSLGLRPGSRVALDGSVQRLFVEFQLLDLQTEETPLALPKPARGHRVTYNYSKVVPVDQENHGPRRQLLRRVLQGRNPSMESIRFTVVSEPPEAEEQERECEDVGVAYIRIPEILERQQDLTETSLEVVDVADSRQVVGSLIVSVEGLEAMQAIMEDQDQDREQDQDQDQERTLVSSLLPSA